MNDCELCSTPGGILLWQGPRCRVVRVEHPDYPGFCRVIWQAHVREMTDLSPAERNTLMHTVFAVEQAVRIHFQPDKINLASLGNMTPHLHWHIIPRWQNDKNFPEPIWGQQQRDDKLPRNSIDDRQLAETLRRNLSEHLETT